MKDPRVEKMAKVLVDYSLEIKKGDLFYIRGSQLAAPLIKEVYKEALLRGAHPVVRTGIEGTAYLFYKYATEEQLRYISEIEKLEVEKIDAFLGIGGSYNKKSLQNVDPQKMRISQEARIELQKKFMERAARGELRWCGTQFPTHADAQDAGMSLEEYEDFIFGAAHVDKIDPVGFWKEMEKKQDKIVKFLETKKEFRIVAPDTDLILRTDGRKWINACGKKNFPDGEVFTSPLEDSVSGHIRFTYPGFYYGREVPDIYLEFENGVVKKASASKDEGFLHAMLSTDEGAKSLGEFAFGTNYGIKIFTKNTLFDEKIGGTIHLALGASIPETGGKNISAIHWDIVLDMRKGGEVYADGELIYKDGKFLIEL